jgi:hypothetical protein
MSRLFADATAAVPISVTARMDRNPPRVTRYFTQRCKAWNQFFMRALFLLSGYTEVMANSEEATGVTGPERETAYLLKP